MTTVAGTNMASLDGDMLAVSPDTSVVDSNTAADFEGASTTNESIPIINGHKFIGTLAINGELPTTNGGAHDVTERSAHVQDAAKELVHTDVVVVGAGFSGISAIYRLRKLGMKIRAFEAGSDFGGVWYWNRYPGARVDSETPFYQLNIPEIWQTWNFKQRFPDHVELRDYCAHIDEVLGLRKDVEFDSRVNSVTYDNHTARWTVKTDNGRIATCKYVILATGLLHQRFIPDFPGLDSFEGEVHHSGFWPDNLSVKGKKVGLIGAGATAVQITQELGKQADQLTVFLRRPSYCLPMRQRCWSELENLSWKPFLERLFDIGRLSRTGFPTSSPACGVFDVTREERESWFEKLWERGAFNFLMGNYNDVLLDRKANREIYNFWQKKTAERLKDPAKRAIMAPKDPPYFFGTKRNPLEHDYYEVLDRSNVAVIDLNKTPLKTFQPKGMTMSDDTLHEFDMVVLATGFDSFTGSLCNMGLKNKHGVDMKEVWCDGVCTYLGMMTAGFPNMFMTYSPQAPTALSNGPTILECQIDFVVDTIAKLESEGARTIEPLRQSEVEWKEMIIQMNNRTLLPFTSSWWTGGNIPGKKAEPMTYIAGIDNYEKQCRATMDGWKGFEVVYGKVPEASQAHPASKAEEVKPYEAVPQV